MTEIQRWKEVCAARIANGTLNPGMIPGYLYVKPLSVISVPSPNHPEIPSTYWSFQSMLKIRTQALVGDSVTQKLTSEQVHALLNQTANDAATDLGTHDPELAQRKALVLEYLHIFQFGVTPVA